MGTEAARYEQCARDGIDVDALVGSLTDRLSLLAGFAAELEVAVSRTHCECGEISKETIEAYQRLDYLRQSLEDVHSVLVLAGRSFEWKPSVTITFDQLRNEVSMLDTLAGLRELGDDDTQSSRPEIWS